MTPHPQLAGQLACARELAVDAGYIIKEKPSRLRLFAGRQIGIDRVDAVVVQSAHPGGEPATRLTVVAYSGTGDVDGRVSVDPSGPSLEASRLCDAIRDQCGIRSAVLTA